MAPDLMRGLVLVALVLAVPPANAASWSYYQNSNAMNGCGLTCTNSTAPFVCLGNFQNATACEAICAANSKCTVMTWSSVTGNCWMRTDNAWDPQPVNGLISGCNVEVISSCASAVPVTGPILATISTATVLGRTHPLSPAITLDFWRWDDPNYGPKWGNSSALYVDLTNPQFKALASSLAPAILRLGGSPEDSLIFDADGTCVPMSGGNGPAPNGYYCSQVKPYSYDCLTPTRWNQLLQFASETGLKVAIGLNGCYGRMSADSLMDLSNIKELLQATVTSPYVSSLWGFEFSNEVVPNTISPIAWAADMTAIKILVSDMFASAGLPLPGMVGPDQSGASPIASVAAVLPAGVLNAYTYHQYPECTAPNPADGFVFDPSCLYQLDTQAQQCVAAAAANSSKDWPTPPVWSGEGADHSGGGIANLTDTFRSSFYYAWQLGALPANGVELAARQCLVGGDYELLQHPSFQPNPDFYIAWLFHSLIGGNATAFGITQNVSAYVSGVRVFAFSAAAATNSTVTLLALNLQSSPISVTLAGIGSSRVEYHLTGDVTTEHGPIWCNGVPLVVSNSTILPPKWQDLGVKGQGSAVLLEPATIAFITVA